MWPDKEENTAPAIDKAPESPAEPGIHDAPAIEPGPTISAAGLGAGTFEYALANLKFGRRVARTGWNGKNQWVQLYTPVPGDALTQPFIYFFTTQGESTVWCPSQTDLLMNDWIIL